MTTLSQAKSPRRAWHGRLVQRTRGRTHGPSHGLMSPSDSGEILKPFVFLVSFDHEGAPFNGASTPLGDRHPDIRRGRRGELHRSGRRPGTLPAGGVRMDAARGGYVGTAAGSTKQAGRAAFNCGSPAAGARIGPAISIYQGPEVSRKMVRARCPPRPATGPRRTPSRPLRRSTILRCA